MNLTDTQKIEQVKNILTVDMYDAVRLARKLFLVEANETTCLHQKCKFVTYLWAYALEISKNRILFIMESDLGSVVSIESDYAAFHEFEYQSRAKKFQLQ